MIPSLSPALATSQARIFLYAQNVDMRKSFDGLFGIVQAEFKHDLRLGDLFLFLNRRGDRIKLIYWDRDGLAIWMKRLERGTFQRPVRTGPSDQIELDVTALTLLLSGIELTSARRRGRYSVDSKLRSKLEAKASSSSGSLTT